MSYVLTGVGTDKGDSAEYGLNTPNGDINDLSPDDDVFVAPGAVFTNSDDGAYFVYDNGGNSLAVDIGGSIFLPRGGGVFYDGSGAPESTQGVDVRIEQGGALTANTLPGGSVTDAAIDLSGA